MFTDEEYAARLTATRAAMQERGLAALFVADPANLYYLTGYNAWSFYVPQALFVPAEGDPLFFTRAMDAHGAGRTARLPKSQIVGYPEVLIHLPGSHSFSWVADELRRRGAVADLGAADVGYEGGAHFFTVETFLALQAGLPEWHFVDSGELVNWVRVVKSPAEIELMRAAGKICDATMNVAVEAIRPGRRQNDAAADILAAQASGTVELAGDYASVVPMLPTGEGADTPHLTWGPAKFKHGEAVVIELAGVHQRYHAPLARTVMLGSPTADLVRLADVTRAALEGVLAAMQQGVIVRDFMTEFNAKLAEGGFSKPSRLGYSIGVGYPPDWGERTVSLRVEDTTVLRENMTFHAIAGMWMDGYGYELSESVRITDGGPEVFSTVPRELIVKP